MIICGAAEELGEALKKFVEKEEKTSIADAFNKSLTATQAAAMVDLTQQEDAEAQAAAGADDGLHNVPQTAEAMALHVSDTVSKAAKKLQADARVKYADGASQAAARLQEEAGAEAEAELEAEKAGAHRVCLPSPTPPGLSFDSGIAPCDQHDWRPARD